jgi:hypothetical protein
MGTDRNVVSRDELLLAPPGTRAAVPAQAMPFSEDQTPSPGRVVDVVLLNVPSHGEPFVLRAPRGTFVAGGLFGVRFLVLGRPQLALVRVLEVTQPAGVSFELVGAHLVRPAGSEPQPPATETTMTLVSLGAPGERMRLLAPRGAIGLGAHFALRYFDATGAKRGLVRVDGIRAQSGMLDEIEGSLVGPATPAPQRESYRAPLDMYFTGELLAPGARAILGRLTDLSADGVGFQVDARLDPGVRIRIHDPALSCLHGAEFAIVRRDPNEGQRHGARFIEPRRGVVVLASLLALDRPERPHPRRGAVATHVADPEAWRALTG